MAAVKKAEDKAAAAGPKVVKAGVVTVTVAGPGHITHDGRIYKPGQSVELPAEVAAGLIGAGLATKGGGG